MGSTGDSDVVPTKSTSVEGGCGSDGESRARGDDGSRGVGEGAGVVSDGTGDGDGAGGIDGERVFQWMCIQNR